jgi:lipid-A-disaccharide synthase
MLEKSCLIVAGEKSGEEHAMSFLPDLITSYPGVRLFGVGGDEMRSLGVELLYHLKDFSSWGFSEVIGKIPFYFRALSKLEEEVERRNCKVAIVIDFQDFNLRLTKKLSKKGVHVLYYVAPQAWAWKAYRAKTLGETVHTLFTIIPFEKKWFSEKGVRQVRSVPHPLWFHYKDKIKNLLLGLDQKPYGEVMRKPRILCLPGSRNFEVENLLPSFVQVKKSFPSALLGIVTSPNVKNEIYDPYRDYFDFTWGHDEIEQALSWAHVALAASGTVTLTCALFEVPTVVCYQTSLLNEFIYHTFIDYDGPISLANIVHEEMVFPELIQEQATPYNINKALECWLQDEGQYIKTKEKLIKTKDLLTGELNSVGEYMAQVIEKG